LKDGRSPLEDSDNDPSSLTVNVEVLHCDDLSRSHHEILQIFNDSTGVPTKEVTSSTIKFLKDNGTLNGQVICIGGTAI
jgi:hypothetical protein